MGQVVMITGAGCFIGRQLTKKLLVDGNEVIAILRENSNNTNQFMQEFPSVQTVMLDMSRYNELALHIDRPCDVLVSLAWNGTRGGQRQNEAIHYSNFKSNIAVLKAAFELGVKTFVSAGSQAEYGLQQGLVSEDHEENPVTAYGKYKLQFYKEAKKLCAENNVRILEPRFFSLYGVGDYPETLIMSTIEKMGKNALCEFSDCEQSWNFLHVKDAAAAMVYLIAHEDIAGGVYNFANKATKKLKEFIIELKRISNTKSELNFGVLPHNDSGSMGINPDASKLYNTGWKDTIDFENGIREIININRGCK